MTEFRSPQPLRAGDALSEFHCGVESLDIWIRSRARDNEKRGASRTFVSLTGEGVVAGYYCLSASSVARVDSPRYVSRQMPDPIPVVLLGRLAVDERFSGHGLGRSLLTDAVTRAMVAAETVAAAALLVHAISESAVTFYEKFGFTQFPESSQSLFLRFADASTSLEP